MWRNLALTALLGWALGGCGRAGDRLAPVTEQMMAETPPPAPEAMPAGEAMRMAGPGAAEAPAPAPSALANRKIVYTAQFTIEVTALDEAIEQARQVAASAGGYLSHLEVTGDGLQRRGTLQLRVPVGSFEQAVAALGKLGRILSRGLRTDDVTEQWIDLDTRIANLKHEEQDLLRLMDRAGKVSELLEVERELSRVRGECERLTAQFRNLKQSVELTTIDVTLSLPRDVEAAAGSGSWLRRIVADAGATFIALGKGLVGVVVYLVFVSPYLALVVLLVWWVRRRRSRDRTGRASAA